VQHLAALFCVLAWDLLTELLQIQGNIIKSKLLSATDNPRTLSYLLRGKYWHSWPHQSSCATKNCIGRHIHTSLITLATDIHFQPWWPSSTTTRESSSGRRQLYISYHSALLIWRISRFRGRIPDAVSELTAQIQSCPGSVPVHGHDLRVVRKILQRIPYTANPKAPPMT
jgi:hypothetical protein